MNSFLKKRAPLKEQSLAILKDRAIPVGTVLDVGVLTGTPELITAYPRVRHVLFEPVAECAPAIARTYRNVTHDLVDAALGNSMGTAVLKVDRKNAGPEITHAALISGTDGEDGDIRTVRKITLDSYIASHDLEGPFLLKIDIDGLELDVLEGARETLPQCSIVIVECAGPTLPQRIEAVQSAGFTLFDLAEPCYYDGSFWQCDAIFVRKDLHEAAFSTISQTAIDMGLYTTFKA